MAGTVKHTSSITRFGLIGCGAIGSAMDEDAPDGPSLTHAGAIGKSTRSTLAALCDGDAGRLMQCGNRRNVAACYTDYRAMLADCELDAVSICTHPIDRLDMIAAIMDAGIRTIWCEKPLAASLDEADELTRLLADFDGVFAVNYLRRWSPGLERIRTLIASEALGAPQYAVAHYGKGIANNGSHVLDLMNALFGPPSLVRALRCLNDGRQDHDPTLDVAMTYTGPNGAIPVYLMASDHRRYSVFEIDLFMSAGRIRLQDKGETVEIFPTGPDSVFPGYTALQQGNRETGGLAGVFDRALDDILDCHYGLSPKPRCCLADGVLAIRIVDAIKISWENKSESMVVAA